MNPAFRDKLRFMLITDRHAARWPLVETVGAALEGGITAVQLREKDLAAGELFELAVQLRKLTREFDALLIINDRVDVALAAEADGVHLGWTSLDPLLVRSFTKDQLIIGTSTHNIVEVRRALRSRVDYLIFGPVFPTPSKEGLVDPVGVTQFKKMAVPSPVPVIAVGGITAENAAEVFQARASGIAVIRAIIAADNPRTAASAIITASPPPLPAPADQITQ